jgi:hypothetical protein
MIWLVLAALPEIDLDQYLPPIPPPIECPDRIPDYPIESLPFEQPQELVFWGDSGTLERYRIRPGYLVSECELLKMTDLQVRTRRLERETAVMRTLRAKEHEIWRIQERETRQQLERMRNPDWLTRNSLAIGMVIGVVGTTVSILAASQAF